MDLSQLAVLLQDLGDNTELINRIKSIVNQSEATDLLQHFHLDAVVTDECTTHTEYQVAQGLVPREIKKRWYRGKEPIGRGTYGTVWMEREGAASNQRAVKIMEKGLMMRHGIDYKKELLALAKFSKPQYQQQEVLVKFLGWCEESLHLFLYMEYFELGDLENHITGSMMEDDIKDITTNLLNGLRIMHREGFTHRDLKPGNIFVVQKPPGASWWVKIGDFGISKRVNHELTALYTSIGTRLYMAPEVTGDLDTDEPTSKYTNAVDMWSLGCVVYKIATQVVPFPAGRDLWRFCAGGPFPGQPLLDRITAEGTDFVKRLLVLDPRDRLSAESALQASWLSQRRRSSEDSIRIRAQPSSDPKNPEAGPIGDLGMDPSELEATATISTSRLAFQSEQPQTGELRESRRDSAGQQQKHQATSTNGKPMSPPKSSSPLPNRVRDIVDRDVNLMEATVRLSAPRPARRGEPPQPQSPQRSPPPGNGVKIVQRAVTATLVATKRLLETLTEWSREKASEGDVSRAFVSCGYEFNLACRVLKSVGIETGDSASIVDRLRTVLEDTLSQDASPLALNRYLPRISEIIVEMLKWMKQKQALLPEEMQKKAPEDGRSDGTGGKGDTLGEKNSRWLPAPTREPPVTTAESSHRCSAAIATTTTQAPEDYLKRPGDDREVDKLFRELMEIRGWINLPALAKQQMLAYPAAKKWVLIHQHRLTELQSKKHRSESGQILGRIDEEGSPEWYVKKIIDGTITTKQLERLSVAVRTQPISWVKAFLETRGLLALTDVLTKINRKSSLQSALGPVRDDRDRDNERIIVRCVKALMNNKYGVDDALAHQPIVVSLINSLVSPDLITRKLVSEILTFLSHWGDGQGCHKVLEAIDIVKDQHHKAGRFDFWIPSFELAIDNHLHISDSKLDSSQGIDQLDFFLEYCLSTTFLINMLVDKHEDDLTGRCYVRSQFIACGIKSILTKLELFQNEAIDKQIEHFRENEAIDYEDLLQLEEEEKGPTPIVAEG
ncbi:kinase-like protein [Penicillium macrosclerotiorum]|uniref:kinase-like protein n=1 Tax=Penicillium macrosclerotiorum TaxID=303699 RepID=UPI0025488E00|nr:kinase-like protein [Penicillium macrosclerotiorum]KAJ5675687.1 kinase-like protein [Penicillium macrosclerotiorum]